MLPLVTYWHAQHRWWTYSLCATGHLIHLSQMQKNVSWMYWTVIWLFSDKHATKGCFCWVQRFRVEGKLLNVMEFIHGAVGTTHIICVCLLSTGSFCQSGTDAIKCIQILLLLWLLWLWAYLHSFNQGIVYMILITTLPKAHYNKGACKHLTNWVISKHYHFLLSHFPKELCGLPVERIKIHCDKLKIIVTEFQHKTRSHTNKLYCSESQGSWCTF